MIESPRQISTITDMVLSDTALDDIYENVRSALRLTRLDDLDYRRLIYRRAGVIRATRLSAIKNTTSASAATVGTSQSIDPLTPEAIIDFIQTSSDMQVCFPIPRLPSTSLQSQETSIRTRIDALQSYISTLSYNYVGEPFFMIKKSASVRNLMRVAQDIMTHALPIKCLEAVVVGLCLTMKFGDLQRMTVSFKSECDGQIYRHIVLVLKLGDRWGAIGLSRRSNLMNKEIRYKSLSELMLDYKNSYTSNHHKLLKIKLGAFVPHNVTSNERLVWKKKSVRLPVSISRQNRFIVRSISDSNSDHAGDSNNSSVCSDTDSNGGDGAGWATVAREIDTHARSMRYL